MLRNAAENLIRDKDASHDIVQEVFLKLWHRREELSEIVNHKAYLFRAVINASLSFIEKNKKTVSLTELRIETGSSTDTSMMTKELQSKIQGALDSLPPKCKAVFVLSRFDELKNKEIADILGLSVKTVENQMGIALKKMREHLKPYMGKDILLTLLSGTTLISGLLTLCC
jgi:RNA polymerase sigma-70 factor, ECF subfamily